MRPKYFLRFFSGLAIFSLACFSISAQRVNPSGTGGIHTIQGRIYLPSGRPAQTQISVKLQSSNYSTLSVISDQNGSFVFRSLAPGNYAIVIEIDGNYEVATEYITIDTDVQIVPSRRGGNPKIFTVPIYLQYKRNANPRPEVINAKLAEVPKEALKHYEQAVTLARNNQNGSAILEYQKAISIYPQFTLALVEMGKTYLMISKLDNAISAFVSALKLEPKNFEANLGYGISLLNKKQLEPAEKHLRESIQLNNSAVTPHYYLGLVLLQTKRFDEAQKEMEMAKEKKGEKTLPLVHYYLGGIYWNKKQYQLAADELEKYLQLSPDIPDAPKIRQTITDLRNKQN